MGRKHFNLFLFACFLTSIGFLIYSFRAFSFPIDISLLLFGGLLLFNANHQIKSETASFSITFPLLFPVIAFYGPAWACLLASWGSISLDEFDDNSWPVFAFNRGLLGLSAGVSSLVFHHLHGIENLVTALLAATFTYSLVNAIIYAIARQLQQPGSSISILWENQKTLIPSFALAAFFSYAYQTFNVFGVIGVFYLFITVRSGALLGHLETNYRISLIRSLLRAVYAKDHDLMEHLENVAHYSKKLAKRCGYPRWKLQLLDEASYFHDIGKLEISDTILKKPERLTEEEYAEMQNHPVKGMEFLREIPLPRTHKQMVANIANYHHERYDGQGYPSGLKGEDIPLEARIVAIADTWDAMTGSRCYRKPLPLSEAVAEMKLVAGTQLDPKLVQDFVAIIEEEGITQPDAFNKPVIDMVPK